MKFFLFLHENVLLEKIILGANFPLTIALNELGGKHFGEVYPFFNKFIMTCIQMCVTSALKSLVQ